MTTAIGPRPSPAERAAGSPLGPNENDGGQDSFADTLLALLDRALAARGTDDAAPNDRGESALGAARGRPAALHGNILYGATPTTKADPSTRHPLGRRPGLPGPPAPAPVVTAKAGFDVPSASDPLIVRSVGEPLPPRGRLGSLPSIGADPIIPLPRAPMPPMLAEPDAAPRQPTSPAGTVGEERSGKTRYATLPTDAAAAKPRPIMPRISAVAAAAMPRAPLPLFHRDETIVAARPEALGPVPIEPAQMAFAAPVSQNRPAPASPASLPGVERLPGPLEAALLPLAIVACPVKASPSPAPYAPAAGAEDSDALDPTLAGPTPLDEATSKNETPASRSKPASGGSASPTARLSAPAPDDRPFANGTMHASVEAFAAGSFFAGDVPTGGAGLIGAGPLAPMAANGRASLRPDAAGMKAQAEAAGLPLVAAQRSSAVHAIPLTCAAAFPGEALSAPTSNIPRSSVSAAVVATPASPALRRTAARPAAPTPVRRDPPLALARNTLKVAFDLTARGVAVSVSGADADTAAPGELHDAVAQLLARHGLVLDTLRVGRRAGGQPGSQTGGRS